MDAKFNMTSTGPCTTTHNACACVIERMRKLEAVADAARDYRNGLGDGGDILDEALQALDGDARE